MAPAEADPIGNDLRHARPKRRLKRGAACAVCGITNPEVLRTVNASLLEDHHGGGHANDPKLKVVLCVTHHMLVTLRQQGVGVELDWDKDRTVLEKLLSALRSLAVFFEQLARSCIDWADKLDALIAALDRDFPAWRKLGPATG